MRRTYLIDSLYQVELEDSLIRLEAIKKSYQSLNIIHQLQNAEYGFAKNEWMFKEKLLEMQIEQLKQELQRQRKARRREKIITVLKGVAVGVGIGIVIAL